MKRYSPDGGDTWKSAPTDPAKRDALTARLVWLSVPRACCDCYEESPSRDFWKACLVTFQENMNRRLKGVCHDYMLKCALDRLFAVRNIDPGTVSSWPLECNSYLKTYQTLWTALPEEQRFAALMFIVKQLKQIRNCTIPMALAQTCWLMKNDKNSRSVDR